MMRPIVVPVDGTPFARPAVLEAVRLARLGNAPLHLVHVTPRVAYENPADTEFLYALAAECRSLVPVTVSPVVLHGPVSDALAGYVRRVAAGMVVISSHSRRGLVRMCLGSVADGLILRSGVPVMVVRPPSLGTALGDDGCSVRTILVPLDGSSLSESVLEAASDLATLTQSSMTLLRVVRPVMVAPGTLYSSMGPAPQMAVDEAHAYLSRISASLAGRGIRSTIRVVISEEPQEAIRVVASQEGVDLVTMATHGLGGLRRALVGSVADRVMALSPVSVMVLHPGDDPLSSSRLIS